MSFFHPPLAATQAKILKEQYHIYMLSSGRMNMCGITSHNVDYVARSIRDVISESFVSCMPALADLTADGAHL